MKKLLIVIGVILILIVGGLAYLRLFYTKSFSPEAESTYDQAGTKIHVLYNQPSKKGREIFGKDALVPFGRVWRTGANEATVFETNKDLSIQGKILKKGSYSLWALPNEQAWTIIFNSETGQWGVNFDGEANRKAENDVVTVDVPTHITQDKEFEKFEISIEKSGEELELIFMWDKTVVALPFTVIED